MTEEKNELIEIIDELSKNAMFRLSLCSKELFHSNFWAWLIEQNPKFITIFGKEFDNVNSVKDINLLREEKICTAEHEDLFTENKIYKKKCIADLAFICNDNLYIIENKLKSLPDEEQINDYLNGSIEDKYNNYKGKRNVILISFTKPVFINESKFTYISYQEICNKLNELKYLFDKNNENKIILESYIKYLDLMNKLKDSLSLKNNNLTYGELLKKINDEKIQEKINKFHFDTFIKNIMYCNLVTDLLDQENPKYKNLFTCVTYSSRAKHSYMDIMIPFCNRTFDEVYKYRKSAEEDFKVFLAGIQIAGEEYRKYFNVIKKVKQKDNETKYKLTYNLYQKFNEFIDETNEEGNNCTRKDNNGFYCYDYEDDAWLYRKTKVDIKSLTFEKLKEQISKDLVKISKKINQK